MFFFHAVPMVQPSLIWGNITSVLSHWCVMSQFTQNSHDTHGNSFVYYIICSNASISFSTTFLIFLQVVAFSVLRSKLSSLEKLSGKVTCVCFNVFKTNGRKTGKINGTSCRGSDSERKGFICYVKST